MKIIFKSLLILITMIISFSCVKEAMIKSDPSFFLSLQREGKTDALAGDQFYVVSTGSGEFITLFDGTPDHVWGEPGAKGKDFDKADSLAVSYSTAGKYTLSLVSTSTGDFGNNFSRNVQSLEINVVDERNSVTVFNINGVDGTITKDNEILFTIPDVVTDYNFVPIFGLQSDLSKVTVNGVEQTSAVTSNDFSQPVVYTVKAAQGNEKQYTVKFSTFPALSDKQITKFAFGIGGNNEIGVFDEMNKVINISSNYATNLKSVRLVLVSSYGSKIYLNNVLYSDRKNYNLTSTGVTKVKVVAQNNSEVEYTINVVLDKPVSAFTFAGLVPNPEGVVDVAAKTISIDVLKGTDITKLVAKWVGSVGDVKIGTIIQTNGVTENDFSKPLIYTFYKGTTAGDKYTVSVNVK